MLKSIQKTNYYVLIVDLLAENKDMQKIKRIEANLNLIDIDQFYDVCQRHEVTSIVYKPLSLFYKNPLPSFWEEEYLRVKYQISFMLERTRFIGTKLAESGIPIVILKNGGIALQLMDDAALCPMGDIDSLVRKEDFRKAHDVILENGFKFKFRSEFEDENIENAFFDGGTEYSFENENGEKMWLELSHRAISGRWIRLDKEPKTELLIKNSQFIPDTNLRVLSPEDNLLQVSIHTAKHSYVREPGFRLHLDVDRIVSRLNIDWHLFIQKVNETGCKTAVYFSLFLSKALFDTQIPDNVLEALKPEISKGKRILRMIENAGIMEPADDKFNRVEFIRFQLSLYDSQKDAFRVILPSIEWLKEKYSFKSSLLVPFYLGLRIIDLAGIRKKHK
jgi:hypothetical protein